MAEYLILIYGDESASENADVEETSIIMKGHQEFGERNAAACRAAAPSADAKLAAWESLTSGDLPHATSRAVLGGFTDVGEYANVGLSSVLHQFTTIGAFAMVGMGSIVSKDVPPFVKAYGNPMQVTGVNTVGLGRAGIDEAAVAQVAAWYATGEPRTDPVVARLLAAYEARRKEAHRAELLLPRATR